MADSVIKRSQRFTRAARAERDRLARRRATISKKREELQSRIDLLDGELEAVDQEISALETLAMRAGEGPEIRLVEAPETDGPDLLKGAPIRVLAVPLLLKEQGTAPIHYRDWLALLSREGYSVAGKRPEAVFLNQVVRSPLVTATTKSGFYRVDLDLLEQLRERLRREQAELAELMREAPGEIGEQFERFRERQRELNIAVARSERELAEALAAIEAWKGDAEDVAPAADAA